MMNFVGASTIISVAVLRALCEEKLRRLANQAWIE
jgi:hypothetical protein